MRFFLFAALLLSTSHVGSLGAQNPVVKDEGIEIIVSEKSHLKTNSYFLLNGGYQNQYFVTVPMIPENTASEKYTVSALNEMQATAEGYSFGLGVLNKTNSFFEVGLLGDYYNNKVSITKKGERSMGPWVLEKLDGTSDLTDPFQEDNHRVSEVFAVRACVRLKLPLGPLSLWGGIAGGSYTTTIRYTDRDAVSFLNSERKTMIAPSYQLGLDYLLRNSDNKDMLSFTLFADFASPKMEESILDIVIPGWNFETSGGNKVMSPVRFGLAIGIH